MAQPADVMEPPFHFGKGKEKPAWGQKARKRIEACTSDYQAVLRGEKPIYAQPDPSQESTATDQFYQGERYQIHVTKTPVVISGLRGFLYGPIVELEEGFAEGEMLSILHTAFYTAEEMKQPAKSEIPFHVGPGTNKPAWNEKAQKRIAACMADYQAVLDGKKPVYAKSAQASEPHFYQGEGYQLDIIKESITLGGVRGFLYGLMLDLDAEPGKAEDLESISHVTFYTVPELKKLLGTP